MASQGHSIVAVVFVDRCCQLFHIQRHRREEAVQNVKVQLPAIPRIIESKSIWQLAYEFRSCRCSPQQPGTSWPCSLTLFVLWHVDVRLLDFSRNPMMILVKTIRFWSCTRISWRIK